MLLKFRYGNFTSYPLNAGDIDGNVFLDNPTSDNTSRLSISAGNPDVSGQPFPLALLTDYRTIVYRNSQDALTGSLPYLPASKTLAVRIYNFHNAGFTGGESMNVSLNGVAKSPIVYVPEAGKTSQFTGVSTNTETMPFSIGQNGIFSHVSAIVVVVPKPSFTLSKTNPQTGETVDITNTSTDLVSYAWKLDGATISTLSLTNLSAGTHTLELTGTDAFGQTFIFSRSFFVGNLTGASSTPVGGSEQYATNVPSPKWGIQGSSNAVSGTENYIDSTGKLYKNKAETVVLKSFEHGWTDVDSSSYYTIDSSGNVVRTVANNSIFLNHSWIKESGDESEFEIPSYWDGGNGFGLLDGESTGYALCIANGTIFYNLVGGATVTLATGISMPSGAKFKIRKTSEGYLQMLKNGAVIATREKRTLFADANLGNQVRIISANAPVSTIIKRPDYISSSLPQKLATKTVNVYTAATAGYAVSTDPTENEDIQITSTATGDINGIAYVLDGTPVGSTPNITLNLPAGIYTLTQYVDGVYNDPVYETELTVNYKYITNLYQVEGLTRTVTLPAHSEVKARVRVVDKAGNKSAWSNVVDDLIP